MAERDLPDFSGKVVTFYVSDAPRGMDAGVTMEYAEFRQLGDRLFVLGRIPEMAEAEWVAQLQSGIAWDSVVHYLVFNSREEFQTRMKGAKPSFLRKLFARPAG